MEIEFEENKDNWIYVLEEYYENGEYNDTYNDILELSNCDLLVVGNADSIWIQKLVKKVIR